MKCFSEYYGLMFDCPVGVEKSNCIFLKIRQLPINERFSYLDVMTETEKKTLIEKHQNCLKVRETSPFFTNRNNVD